MANIFTNRFKPSIGTANTTVYQAPIATSSTVIGLSIANRTTSNTITISAYVLDSSNSYTATYIVNNATVPIGGTIVVVGGDQKLVLKEFINSVDSTPKLREFYNTKITEIKATLTKQVKKVTDKAIQIKLNEVNNMLTPLGKTANVGNDDLVNLLQYYELLEELTKING